MKISDDDSVELLRSKGLKATAPRVKVLELLGRATRPIGIPELVLTKKSHGLDTVTLYRSLEALCEARIVRRVDLRHGHTDYELQTTENHHHHLVCEKCEALEEVDWCPGPLFEDTLIKKSKNFVVLTDHSLEFFGICKKCAFLK